MAEFMEVMRQAKRMCRMYENSCTGCPIADQDDRCMFEVGNADCIPESWDLRKLRNAEELVMAWAAANPEPRYPTWAEWQDANFPDAYHHICPGAYLKEPPLGSCKVNCEDCYNQPIPADIAEKLGIKPIGGAE